jgi:hypothetical protein
MESDISVLLGDDVLHPVYLPFSAGTLSRHFAPVSRAITDLLRPRWFVPTESTRASLFISQSRSEARETYMRPRQHRPACPQRVHAVRRLSALSCRVRVPSH